MAIESNGNELCGQNIGQSIVQHVATETLPHWWNGRADWKVKKGGQPLQCAQFAFWRHRFNQTATGVGNVEFTHSTGPHGGQLVILRWSFSSRGHSVAARAPVTLSTKATRKCA